VETHGQVENTAIDPDGDPPQTVHDDPELGEQGVITPLWEWSVTRDAEGGSAGLSATRHAAMEALAKALIRGGRPRRGRVTQVFLTEPVHQASHYLRGWPKHIAVYDGRVLRWR
jgi:hypothetical protein